MLEVSITPKCLLESNMKKGYTNQILREFDRRGIVYDKSIKIPKKMEDETLYETACNICYILNLGISEASLLEICNAISEKQE
jgi:hypothetical protein